MRWLWEPDDERDNDHRTRPGVGDRGGGGTLVTCSAPRRDRCMCVCEGGAVSNRCVRDDSDDDGDDDGNDKDKDTATETARTGPERM